MSVKEHSGEYYIPNPSPWPIIGMASLLMTLMGTALAINGVALGQAMVVAGLLLFFYLLFGWFRDVIKETVGSR